MPHPQFDRFAVRMEPLAGRENLQTIANGGVSPSQTPRPLSREGERVVDELAERIVSARRADRPVIAAFGAHTIRNGLGPVLQRFIEQNWFTHLATNGAGIIHDWEFAFQGQTSESVAQMVADGRFGNWQETGFSINLALNIGAWEGKGYGESVGALIENDGLDIPSEETLQEAVRADLQAAPARSAAAADLLHVVRAFQLPPGRWELAHEWKRFSIQSAAWRLGVPFTGHPMIGHDIIYNHPMNQCAALGRAAERDFLTYATSVSGLAGGVHLSIGSAVMAPMIFEKALSIARNVAHQQGERIDDHFLCVSDLAASTWDWSRGEPPADNPAYYLRYNKSFSRMGGTFRYVQADNRDLLLHLLQRLEAAGAA